MKAKNTKARSLKIQTAATLLLTGVDITQQYPFRKLAKRLAAQESCHITTAKRHLATAARRARGEMVRNGWGGTREPKGGRPTNKAFHSTYRGQEIFHDATKTRRPWSVKVIEHNRWAEFPSLEIAQNHINKIQGE